VQLWPVTCAGQAAVHVNVYESGKCSIMSVPSVEVAEELADVVTDLLMEAYEETLNLSEHDAQEEPASDTLASLPASESTGDGTWASGGNGAASLPPASRGANGQVEDSTSEVPSPLSQDPVPSDDARCATSGASSQVPTPSDVTPGPSMASA
jgi:hypothetical protein